MSGEWTTAGFRLPAAVFDQPVIVNPLGTGAREEGVWGYADHSPTLVLGDVDADNVADDDEVEADVFYTWPDDPFAVGMTGECGGGDAFDIAWAVDAETGENSGLDGFDFIRIRTGSNVLVGVTGEISTDIDAAADVRVGMMGDWDADGDVDVADFGAFSGCGRAAATGRCRVFDFDVDGGIGVIDFGRFQAAFTGPL